MMQLVLAAENLPVKIISARVHGELCFVFLTRFCNYLNLLHKSQLFLRQKYFSTTFFSSNLLDLQSHFFKAKIFRVSGVGTVGVMDSDHFYEFSLNNFVDVHYSKL